MKILYYVLTAFFGLLGVLSFLRSVEVLFFGGGKVVAQFLIALVFLLLAGAFLKKTRTFPS